jgi:hypothetical protein
MPISTQSTFVCDRDGVTGGPVDADPNMSAVTHPPEGWMRIMWDGVREGTTSMVSGTGFLCPACTAAFKAFIGPPENERMP